MTTMLFSPKPKPKLTPVAKQSSDESGKYCWCMCPVQPRTADHSYWTVSHFIIFIIGVGQTSDKTSSCNFHSILIRNTMWYKIYEKVKIKYRFATELQIMQVSQKRSLFCTKGTNHLNKLRGWPQNRHLYLC